MFVRHNAGLLGWISREERERTERRRDEGMKQVRKDDTRWEGGREEGRKEGRKKEVGREEGRQGAIFWPVYSLLLKIETVLDFPHV